ncbi:hypothetical protein WR25_18078 [Diploscapter pachys]|uniref:MARVEL domain-containing protein n=1 Tax=Diploscapter pachys TaxID=2018661 RepID=A0A2A2LKI8_9BILA|nr:hypothetical protein WR25_18078 [Diploscapter pachys]
MAYPSAPSQNQDYNPPSYEEAQRNVFDAPPSYDSLYGQLREVDSPKGLAVFLRNACNAISNTLAAAIALAILNILPIAMIVIGSLNLNDCPDKEILPKWLLISGIFYLIRSGINFLYRLQKAEQQKPLCTRCIESLIEVFLFIWFILGCIWAISAYSTDNLQCDRVVVLFSFIYVVCSLALLALSCFLFCCCCCCICFKPKQEPNFSTA